MGRLTELRQRLLFLLGALIVYRIGTFILFRVSTRLRWRRCSISSRAPSWTCSTCSPGALSRASLFALGIMPYISASIIIQLMTSVIPKLEQLKKEGESGRRKITQYTRYGTLGWRPSRPSESRSPAGQFGQGLVVNTGPGFVFTATVSLVSGTMFLMWLGEQITERGLGNGILDDHLRRDRRGLPAAFGSVVELVSNGEMNALFALFLFLLAIAVTGFVVFVERGQRRITVNYAKRQQGRKMYAAQSSHLPLKLNMAGVIPPIFASSIILFPTTLAQWAATTRHALVAGYRGEAVSGRADLRRLVCGRDHLFCFSTPRWCSTRKRLRTT